MFNDFKESLKIKRLSNTTAEQEIKNTYKAQNLESYNKLANNAESLGYIHNVIAAILLGLNKANPESQFYIPYRIKAPESKEKKLNKRLNKSKVIYDEEQNSSLDVKPSFDDIALKIIIEKSPLRRNFKDKELSALAKQYEKNKHILSQMQEFSEKLIEDEFSLPENREYKFEVSKKEYYEKCRELILHTKSLFHKKSTNILEKFDNSISYIENKLKELKEKNIENEMVDIHDLNNPNANFLELVRNYETEIPNELELAILTKQVFALFNSDERLKKLGVSIVQKPIDKKVSVNRI